ncbi:AP-3 complex subunit sigma-1, partial [Plecturocebus cupreus]
MIKAILIFNNHGKPRLSKFYQPYVSIQLLRIRARGSRWRLAAPSAASSERPSPARCGPSRAQASWRSPAVSLPMGVDWVPTSLPRGQPPTWLCPGGSSAGWWAACFPGRAGEALETSQCQALAGRAAVAHLHLEPCAVAPLAHPARLPSCLPRLRLAQEEEDGAELVLLAPSPDSQPFQ